MVYRCDGQRATPGERGPCRGARKLARERPPVEWLSTAHALSIVDAGTPGPHTEAVSSPLSSGGLSILPAVLLSIFGVFFALVAVVGIFVVVVVANRAEPDPTGRRPLAVYYFAVSFFTLFASLFGSFVIVYGLVQLIGSHGGGHGGPGQIHPVGDAVARLAIVGGIVTVVALVVLVVHLRRGLELSDHADPRTGPIGRVAQSYVAAVSFVSILIAVVSIVVALYETVRIIAPGVFEVHETRVQTLRPMLAAAYLALAALVVLMTHIRMLPPDVRRPSATTAPAVSPPPSHPQPEPPPPPPFS